MIHFNAINIRLIKEVATSVVLAFIIVSVVFSASSLAPISLGTAIPLV